MMLARIELGSNGSDLRTFECPKCEHVQKMLVKDLVAVGQHRLDGRWA